MVEPHFAAGFGSSGGVVMAEVWLSDGTSRRVAVVARQDGQRLAVLPAVYVVEQLCRGAELFSARRPTACEILGARPLLDLLAGDEYRSRSRGRSRQPNIPGPG